MIKFTCRECIKNEPCVLIMHVDFYSNPPKVCPVDPQNEPKSNWIEGDNKK